MWRMFSPKKQIYLHLWLGGFGSNRNDIKFGHVGINGEQIVIKAKEWLSDFDAAHSSVTG